MQLGIKLTKIKDNELANTRVLFLYSLLSLLHKCMQRKKERRYSTYKNNKHTTILFEHGCKQNKFIRMNYKTVLQCPINFINLSRRSFNSISLS